MGKKGRYFAPVAGQKCSTNCVGFLRYPERSSERFSGRVRAPLALASMLGWQGWHPPYQDYARALRGSSGGVHVRGRELKITIYLNYTIVGERDAGDDEIKWNGPGTVVHVRESRVRQLTPTNGWR
jgi:hypothetical protein